MSLYHETADILSAPSSTGGNLKTRVFGNKNKQLKSPPTQIYALASEACKWSAVLKEVIDNSGLLRHERKLTPILALLLVHDFLLSRKGIALPASHGLRAAVERHKARLAAELTRARLRRKAASLDALRQLVTREAQGQAGQHPRWVRVNTLKTTLEEQLMTTFKHCTRVASVRDIAADPATADLLYVDEHVPDLLALSPAFEIIKTPAYASGAIIIQDKASCFPAYLLDPRPEDGDVVDSCAAPGNKTTHVAAIVRSRVLVGEVCVPKAKVYAFEKDRARARTLEKMVTLAGAHEITRLHPGQDFLKVDPESPLYKNVGALLLDPSCSGSGIVDRDAMPTIHLPEEPDTTMAAKAIATPPPHKKRKRKLEDDVTTSREKEKGRQQQILLVDDDGQETIVASEKELSTRLAALSSFQLTLLLHAFRFPAAQRVTYSTCSIHAEENEEVVLRALQSEVARERGWRIMKQSEQVKGMREWPVRGDLDACDRDAEVAEACIRAHKDDGRGVMGFFVAGFVRDGGGEAKKKLVLGNDDRENSGQGRAGGHGSTNRNSGLDNASEAASMADLPKDARSEDCSSSDTDCSGGEEWDGFDD